MYRLWVDGVKHPVCDVIAFDNEKIDPNKSIDIWDVTQDTKTVITPSKV